MSNNGDDCYFYYYSTCTKGDSCPFRHCEAAMGNETVCNLWQEGRCFRTVCKFRHMEIKKNRKEIACYWENQPAGCQKPHCAFYHERSRFIDSVHFPPNKGQAKTEEPPQEEVAPPPAPIPTAANPQLRGVLKAETQESVPSPTHPPVVINPTDDDEDEDDQLSEGEEGKVGPDGTWLTSPRKLAGGPNSNDCLNFGVCTLEEIRLRKALKAFYPVPNAEAPLLKTDRKENIRSRLRPAPLQATQDPAFPEDDDRPKSSVIDRLGKRVLGKDAQTVEQPPLKCSLIKRLGRALDDEDTFQKGLKPLRERLGFPVEPMGSPLSVALPVAETNAESKKSPKQIRIKTLEEIRQEKAAKSQNKKQEVPSAPAHPTVSSKAPSGTKRSITVKDSSIVQIKTLSEIFHAKKRKQGEEDQETQCSPKNASQECEKSADKAVVAPGHVDAPRAEVRVKTLEEIRREKAARMQAMQAKDTENGNEEVAAMKPYLLRIKTQPSTDSNPMHLLKAADNIKTKKAVEVKEKLVLASELEVSPDSSNGVTVKSFEEIMREKRLRRQEMEERVSSPTQSQASSEEEPPQKQEVIVTKKVFIRARSTTAAGASFPSTTSFSGRGRKRISLKSSAASPVHSTPATGQLAVTATSPEQQAQVDSASHSPSDSKSSPSKGKRSCQAVRPGKQTRRAAPQGCAIEEPPADEASNQAKSANQTIEIKVRPKLNVKPSVMKPAVQVKPGQKRKAAARSAVAEVKPLNSASTLSKEPPQEPPCKQRDMLSHSEEVQLNPAEPRSPAALLGSGSSTSRLKEDLQTVPVFQQSPGQTLSTTNTADAAASREASSVLQSPVVKTSTQSKSRRPSLASSRAPNASNTAASAVDDFDELMNEFTDDHLEEDMDPGMGEDDLLQELSEMIDS